MGCHVLLVAWLGSPGLMSIVMVALILACGRCSFALWRKPTEGSATSMLVVTVLMLIAHTVLVGFGHSHGLGNSPISSGTSGIIPPALSNILLFWASVVELVIVIQLAFWLRRVHKTAPTPTLIFSEWD